jgi:hypothetical protein
VARQIYTSSHATYCARESRRSGAYEVFSSRFTTPLQLQISAIILLWDITCKIGRTGRLLMTFFVSRRERLEASTEVAGFKSVACRRPEVGVSAAPNPAAETAGSCFTVQRNFTPDLVPAGTEDYFLNRSRKTTMPFAFVPLSICKRNSKFGGYLPDSGSNPSAKKRKQEGSPLLNICSRVSTRTK